MKEPNRGKNYPQAGIGLNYYFSYVELIPPEKTGVNKVFSYWIESGITTRRAIAEDPLKLSVAVNGGSLFQVSPINGMGAGAEINLDFSRKNNLGKNGATVIGPFLSHHFILGKFDFNQRAVWYLLSPAEYTTRTWYQRYVLTYKLPAGFRAGLSLKAHLHVASNIDLRFGWAF
jgi:hypothetical protein